LEFWTSAQYILKQEIGANAHETRESLTYSSSGSVV